MEDRPVNYHIKNLFGQSVIYGLGDIGTKVIGLLLLPLHTSFLTIHEYSVYSLFILFYSFGLTFYMLGINSGFLRYYLDDEYEEKKVFNTAFLFLLIFTILISFIIILLSGWFSHMLFDDINYKYILYCGVVILICESLSTIALLVYRAQNDPSGFVSAVLIKMSVILLSNVVFLVEFKMGIKGAVLGNLCGSGALLLMSSPVIKKQIQPTFSLQVFKKMFRYGIPAVPAVVSITVLIMIDQYLIKYFGFFDKVGIYAAGYKIGMALMLIITGFKLAWFPFIFQTSKQKDAGKIFSRVFTYFNIFLILFYLVICIYIPLVFKYIFQPEYYESMYIIPIIGLGYIFYGCYEHFMVGAYLKDKTFYVALVFSVSAFANIGLNLILIPRYSLYGAATATVLSYFILMVLGYMFSQKFYRVKYNFFNTIKTAAAGLLVMAAYYYYGNHSVTVSLLLPPAYLGLLLVFRSFRKEDKELLKIIVKMK
ncbi:lipopolysaccharide biosynthesis protein [candidate division KSB1 bacterium]